MAKLTRMALIRKIIAAQLVLGRMKIKHKDGCCAITDPESFAPCTCGAINFNNEIDSVIKILN